MDSEGGTLRQAGMDVGLIPRERFVDDTEVGHEAEMAFWVFANESPGGVQSVGKSGEAGIDACRVVEDTEHDSGRSHQRGVTPDA